MILMGVRRFGITSRRSNTKRASRRGLAGGKVMGEEGLLQIGL